MSPSSVRISALDDIGDPDATPGSAAWARWFVRQTKKTRHDLESEASSLRKLLDDLERYEAWKPLGLASFSMLCSRELGISSDQVDAIRGAKNGEKLGAVLGKHGGDRKSEKVNNQGTVSTLIRGETLPYLIARLDRDRPDIKSRLDAGEFPSVRAAALEAGIVQPSFQCPADAMKASRRLLKHFNGEALTTLLTELANHAGYDLTPRE